MLEGEARQHHHRPSFVSSPSPSLSDTDVRERAVETVGRERSQDRFFPSFSYLHRAASRPPTGVPFPPFNSSSKTGRRQPIFSFFLLVACPDDVVAGKIPPPPSPPHDRRLEERR